MPTSDKVINFTASTGSSSLETADYRARIAGPGIEWFHPFESDNEVNNFRWTNSYSGGNDPLALGGHNATLVRRVTNDGFDKGNGRSCLKITHPAGSSDGSHWYRPFSPLVGGTTSGNGRGAGQNDPGALGALAARSFNPTNGGSQTAQHGDGYRGSSQGGNGPWTYDWPEWWFQCRVKLDHRRWQGSANLGVDSGKLFFFTRTDRTNTDQKIIVETLRWNGTTNFFGMYSLSGGDQSLDQHAPGTSVHGNNPGSEFGGVGNGICRIESGPGVVQNCWSWPDPAEWVTLMWHVIPGTNGGSNTTLEVYAAYYGQTKFTRIWRQTNANFIYDPDRPQGHNAVVASCYENGSVMTEFDQLYDTPMLSREWIPCPQIYGTSGSALALASYGLASNASATFTPGLSFSMDEADMAWQSLFYYDTRNNLIQVMGKRANAGTQWKLRTYNVSTGVWTVNDPTAINRDGHIYGIFTIDPATGNLYLMPGSTPADRALYRFVPSGNSGTWSIVADPLWSGALNMPADGLGWHPHLYGTNGGGCITSAETSGTSQTAAIYKASNNAIQNVSVGSFDSGRFYGQGVYFPKINKVVFGGGSHLHVNATTASGTPTFTAVGAPPIPTKGDTMDNTGFGTMMVHPGNPQKMLLIERGGSRRTWTSTDGDSWTQTGTHPFIQPAYALCSCAPLGTVWALGATGTDPGTPYSVLWKPPV
jgi:hypothetical protein